jgi:hypothetical protein
MKHIKLFESFVEEKRGLWDNVWAKRKRGEKPAKPGDEDYPDEDAWDSAQGKKKKNEGLEEMASTDVHYKEIMDLYNSGSFAKKKVASVVCKNPNASQKQIESELAEAGYEDMLEFVDALGIKESKDSDTYLGNPGEDKRMVDIRTFRGTVKDLTDFIEDKIKNQ